MLPLAVEVRLRSCRDACQRDRAYPLEFAVSEPDRVDLQSQGHFAHGQDISQLLAERISLAPRNVRKRAKRSKKLLGPFDSGFCSQIDRASATNIVKMLVEEALGGTLTETMQQFQEIKVRFHLARSG